MVTDYGYVDDYRAPVVDPVAPHGRTVETVWVAYVGPVGLVSDHGHVVRVLAARADHDLAATLQRGPRGVRFEA